MKKKSSLLARHFGLGTNSPINEHSQSPLQSTSSTSVSELSQKSSSELLKRHLDMYEEMMKVQPLRHTEQQIKAERAKEKEKLLQKNQEELERLRGEQKSQVRSNIELKRKNYYYKRIKPWKS